MASVGRESKHWFRRCEKQTKKKKENKNNRVKDE